MEPDGDQKKEDSAQALEVVAEKTPPNTPEIAAENVPENVPESEQGSAPVAKIRLLPRVKQLLSRLGGFLLRPLHILRTAAAKIGVAGRGLLQRFRKPSAEPDAAEDQKHERGAAREEKHAKTKAREEPGKEVQPPPASAPHPHSAVHSVLLYLLVLIIGSIAGMVFSFVLFSTMVSNQAHKIDDQRDEISQLEKQNSRLLESEANYRKENKEYRQRLDELEALEASRNPAVAVPEPAGNPGLPARAKTPVARKTGTCNLDAGNVDNNLTRCVDEFNRK